MVRRPGYGKQSSSQVGAPRSRSAQGRSRQGHAASPARVAARQAIRTLRLRDAFAQDVMARVVDEAPMSPEDRAFATRLVLGVVSTRGVLDEVLDRCMRSPKDVSDDVRDALQVSTYEIIFLDKSPHAAVDQGVELVRSIAPRAAGLANAVLRKVVAAKAEFPFGNPANDMAAYARLHGFPLWLAERLLVDLGAQAAHDFMRCSNEPAPLFVAVNAARANEEEVVAVLTEAQGAPEPVEVNGSAIKGCFRLRDGRVLLDGHVSRLIDSGCLLVSDAASQAVAARVLPDSRPSSLLEIGAGRATKTILLQSNATRSWGAQIEHYVTLDNHDFKTKLLEERVGAYGVHVERALTGDATKLDEVVPRELFDVVFIDAPCTGLGTLRRHPEIRWRLTPEAIEAYHKLGLDLLNSAASHVALGGTLAFATCTVTRSENATTIAAFLEGPQGGRFELLPIGGKAALATSLTAGGSDAHFLALMRRVR